MGTAGLKIKFIPVVKDFHKDSSNCYLEIKPEVSAIQNLEQLEWKEENDFIEYIIPMTYKIILTKLPRQSLKEINYSLNKIYYSCVDLLLPSSLTTFNLASGDVKRIISDTYVVTKVSANWNNTDDTQKLLLNTNSEKEKQEPSNNENSIDRRLFKEEINDSMSNKDETREDIEKHNARKKVLASEDNSSINTVDIKRKSIDKITNTESDFALYTDAYTQSGETITCISTIMNSTSKGYSNKKLSQTPVCSIDADIVKENITSNSVIYYISEINNDTARMANICTINNMCNNNYNKFQLFTKQMSMDFNYTNDLNCKQRRRILPEVRVAELVQVMEKEIMPLKIMLNEILCKCAALGKVWKNAPRVSLMYKTINPNFDDRVAKCRKNHIKSNRVVYSVVFDG